MPGPTRDLKRNSGFITIDDDLDAFRSEYPNLARYAENHRKETVSIGVRESLRFAFRLVAVALLLVNVVAILPAALLIIRDVGIENAVNGLAAFNLVAGVPVFVLYMVGAFVFGRYGVSVTVKAERGLLSLDGLPTGRYLYVKKQKTEWPIENCRWYEGSIQTDCFLGMALKYQWGIVLVLPPQGKHVLGHRMICGISSKEMLAVWKEFLELSQVPRQADKGLAKDLLFLSASLCLIPLFMIASGFVGYALDSTITQHMTGGLFFWAYIPSLYAAGCYYRFVWCEEFFENSNGAAWLPFGVGSVIGAIASLAVLFNGHVVNAAVLLVATSFLSFLVTSDLRRHRKRILEKYRRGGGMVT